MQLRNARIDGFAIGQATAPIVLFSLLSKGINRTE